MSPDDDHLQPDPEAEAVYTPVKAGFLVAKRMVVSLRRIRPDTDDEHSGLWGIVESVHEYDALLRVAGGVDEAYKRVAGDPIHL